MNESPSNFERLVLSCMDSYDSGSRRIFSDFSRSTRSSYFVTAQISKFQRETVQIFDRMKMKFHFSLLIGFFEISMNFAIFRRNFNEFLPEFHRNVQEMTNCLEILRKSARKIQKMLEISRISEKFSFLRSIFQLFSFAELNQIPQCSGITLRAVWLYESF